MVLGTIIVGLWIALIVGKRSKKFGFKRYALLALIALVQMAVAVYSMFTMTKPPLF